MDSSLTRQRVESEFPSPQKRGRQVSFALVQIGIRTTTTAFAKRDKHRNVALWPPKLMAGFHYKMICLRDPI